MAMTYTATPTAGVDLGGAFAGLPRRAWRALIEARMRRALELMTDAQLRRIGLARDDIPARAAALVSIR